MDKTSPRDRKAIMERVDVLKTALEDLRTVKQLLRQTVEEANSKINKLNQEKTILRKQNTLLSQRVQKQRATIVNLRKEQRPMEFVHSMPSFNSRGPRVGPESRNDHASISSEMSEVSQTSLLKDFVDKRKSSNWGRVAMLGSVDNALEKELEDHLQIMLDQVREETPARRESDVSGISQRNLLKGVVDKRSSTRWGRARSLFFGVSDVDEQDRELQSMRQIRSPAVRRDHFFLNSK